MKIKKLLIAIFALSLFILVFAQKNSSAQTTGNLTFSVTTTEPSGGYTNKFVLAIWIRDNAGNFVKTKIKYAAARVQWLNVWVSNSGQNTVDATTGATKTQHGTFTINWNATDIAASLVPDGIYEVWVQMADANANGPTTSVSFTKGPSAVNLTPANSGNFTNMVLNWTPSNIGIGKYSENNAFTVYPNPVTDQTAVNFTLESPADVTISVHDVNGKVIKIIADDNMDAGSYSLPVNPDNNLKNGIYFIKFYNGRTVKTSKIIIN